MILVDESPAQAGLPMACRLLMLGRQTEAPMTRLAMALTVLLPAAALADNYQIDPAHSNATFAVKHMMVSTVRGEFSKITGKVNLDEKDLTRSTLEATIDA